MWELTSFTWHYERPNTAPHIHTILARKVEIIKSIYMNIIYTGTHTHTNDLYQLVSFFAALSYLICFWRGAIVVLFLLCAVRPHSRQVTECSFFNARLCNCAIILNVNKVMNMCFIRIGWKWMLCKIIFLHTISIYISTQIYIQ